MTVHQSPLTRFLFFTVVLVFFFSCQKQIDKTAPQEEISTAANSNSGQGHLQQTKTFSSEVVVKWMEMQLRVIRTTSGMAPAYQTLHGQLL